MKPKPIIESVCTESECHAIRKLAHDPECRIAVQKAIGGRIISRSDVILSMESSTSLQCGISGRALDVMMLTMMANHFTDDPNECLTVAILVTQNMRMDGLPVVTSKVHGLRLAGAILVSLGLFRAGMVARWRKRGAPSIRWYRGVSRAILADSGHHGIAKRHESWEAYLSEVLV